MIEVEITVKVDGVTYGIEKIEQSNPGRNSTLKAIGFFESQAARIKKIMQADVPENTNPVIEKRDTNNVDSGPVHITRC